jgi:hypothetical protein
MRRSLRDAQCRPGDTTHGSVVQDVIVEKRYAEIGPPRSAADAYVVGAGSEKSTSLQPGAALYSGNS